MDYMAKPLALALAAGALMGVTPARDLFAGTIGLARPDHSPRQPVRRHARPPVDARPAGLRSGRRRRPSPASSCRRSTTASARSTSRSPPPTRGAALFHPGARLRLRLQPCRRHRLLPRGAAARSGLRDVLVGRGAGPRAEHQRADGPGRQCARGAAAATPIGWRAKATPAERALTDAMVKRYSPDPNADRAALDAAYADAMLAAAAAHPANDDIALLAAEAAMDTLPWNYWEPDGRTPKPRLGEAVQLVETVYGAQSRPPAGGAPLHPSDGERPRPEARRSRRRPAGDAARAGRGPPRPHAGAHLSTGSAAGRIRCASTSTRRAPTKPISVPRATAAWSATAIIRTTSISSSPRRKWPATWRPPSAKRAAGTDPRSGDQLADRLDPGDQCRALFRRRAIRRSRRRSWRCARPMRGCPISTAMRHYARAVARAQQRNRAGFEQEIGAAARACAKPATSNR